MTLKEYEQLAKRVDKAGTLLQQLESMRKIVARFEKPKGDEDISIAIRLSKAGEYLDALTVSSRPAAGEAGAAKDLLMSPIGAILKAEIERRQTELAKL